MKAKHLFLLGLCAFFFNNQTVLANDKNKVLCYEEPDHLPTGADRIVLHGELMLNIGPNAIEAGATEDAVYIYFNQSFGNVSIAIYSNTEGLVYNTVADSSVQQLVVIPLTRATNGAYIIELNNASGYAEGEFGHNN